MIFNKYIKIHYNVVMNIWWFGHIISVVMVKILYIWSYGQTPGVPIFIVSFLMYRTIQ